MMKSKAVISQAK